MSRYVENGKLRGIIWKISMNFEFLKEKHIKEGTIIETCREINNESDK